MADYNPPIENLPIFDKLLFTSSDDYITQTQADKRYLRFPNAQGTENLQATNINGLLDVNANATFSGRIVQDNTSAGERQITSSYYNISRISNTTTQNGDSRIAMLSDTLYIINETGATTPMISFNFTLPTAISALSLTPTFTNISRNVVMSDINYLNREMTCGKMNFSDNAVSSNAYTSTMVIYNANGIGYMQNLINNGSINFITRSSLNVDENIMSLRNTGVNFSKSIGLADISGGGTTSTILTDSLPTIPGMFYDCNINGGFHIFKVNDGAGVESSPVYYGANLTSISNTITIRNATLTSNRLDISTDSNVILATTTMRLRCATASQTSRILVSCDTVSAGGVITNNPVLTLEPTKGCAFIIPPDTTTMNNPTTTSQCGFVSNVGVTPFSKTSSSLFFTVDSVSLPKGTYHITFAYNLQNTGTTPIVFSQFTMGISSITTAIDIDASIYQTYSMSITNNSAKPEVRNSSGTWRNTNAGNTTLYFLGVCEFTGGSGGNLVMKNNYNIVRII